MFQYTDAWPAELPNGMDEREVYDLKLPYQKMAGADRRILFVFEFVPTEDLHSGKLLGGTTGRLFAKLLSQYEEHFGTWSWTAINFNSWKTFGKSMGFVQSSNEMFAKRVRQYIRKVKPTHVVFLGASGLQHLVPYLAQDDYLEHNIYGVPLPLSPKDPSLGNITLVPSLHNIVSDQDPQGNGPSNLLGYVAKCLRNGVLGRNPYSVGWNEREPKFKLNLIKTVKQFDGMMKEMRAAKAVAIDTETSGLGRVTSKLLTAQFCFADDTAWFLPILHKDAGFSRSKLAHIASELRDYFEGKNKNRYHIYANGKFDLVQFKNNLRVRYFKNRIWDVQHADYILDENMVFLQKLGFLNYTARKGKNSAGYYAMHNLGAQYSAFPYRRAAFGKSDRKTIEYADLDDGLIRYGCNDVLLPFLMHKQQLRRAKHEGYDKFVSMVLDQESDKIHAFAEMEYNGIPADLDYLFWLASEDSVVNKSIQSSYARLYDSKEARQLNAQLALENNAPQMDMFGGASQILDFTKPDHRRKFFFDVLGLDPVEYGKSGEGSLDKVFKETYKDNKHVAAFEEIAKSEQLRNLFVNRFIEIYKEGGDIRKDSRVRPSFGALGVVTGRISEKDPNMQQLPNRGLGPAIKRVFAAPPGHLILKCDYSAHEVRGWALLSSDTVLGDVFKHGVELRNQYRLNPSPELARRIYLEGDSHRLNVAYFFSRVLEEMPEDELATLRDQIKGIIFGLIYGKHNKTLANDINQDVKEVNKLVNKLFKRFKNGHRWLLDTEANGEKLGYVESPLGRRRSLYSWMAHPSMEGFNTITSAANRKARNSPIQGFCSDLNFISCRNLLNRAWEERQRRDEMTGAAGYQLMNVVHDSKESLVRYDWLWWALTTVHESMTSDATRIVKERHNFDFAVPVEIDMELGASLSKTYKWDWSADSLVTCLAKTMVYSQRELGQDVNPYAEIKRLFDDMTGAPTFLQKQVKRKKPLFKPAIAKATEDLKLSNYAVMRSR